jgi:hypothetical protein
MKNAPGDYVSPGQFWRNPETGQRVEILHTDGTDDGWASVARYDVGAIPEDDDVTYRTLVTRYDLLCESVNDAHAQAIAAPRQ